MKHIGISLIHFNLSKDRVKAERQMCLLNVAICRAICKEIEKDKELKDVDTALRPIIEVKELHK